ncbi:MAG: hypothetical protein HeimC3_13200 [Candidatus Heimdallarchaeota archaeon LC_3]|nr:MAG: hypothetical protein HeimC3_13200 [Candidatus Heimdallarchaeota archaeon LC_3]
MILLGITTKVRQIPWKEFVKKQLMKIVGIIIIISMVLFIIQLSNNITPDRNELNPESIIGFDNSTYLLLIITSSTLFLFVLFIFTKFIFIDNKEEFGIDSYRSWRSILVFFLVIAFISAVYLLLDSSLVNIYLVTGPVDLVWYLDNVLGMSMPGIGADTNRLAYAQIRSMWFFGFYIFMIVFPIIMFISILTRYGRTELFEREHKDENNKSVIVQLLKFVLFIFTPVIEIFLVFLLISVSENTLLFIFVFLWILGLALWWLYTLFLIIFRTVKFTAWLSYANFKLIFPIIGLFYLLPGILWSIWDLIKIFFSKSITDTIHDHLLQSDLNNKEINFDSLSFSDYLDIVVKTITFNFTPFDHTIYRILQLDFVIIVGISAIIIGLAEGYSILAIVKSLTKGVSIARTGKVASSSAPKLIVITSRILMLSVWMSLIWDKFLSLYDFVKEEFITIVLPDIPYLPIISYLFQFVNEIISYSEFLVPLAILLIPLFVILISSFKFLSVSIVIERLKHDTQIFFLLISSAFVLITTQILQDITEAFSSDTGQTSFMPFAFATKGNLLPWASKVFENLEAGAFYIGLLIALYIGLKYLMNYIKKKLFKSELVEEIKKSSIESDNMESILENGINNGSNTEYSNKS